MKQARRYLSVAVLLLCAVQPSSRAIAQDFLAQQREWQRVLEDDPSAKAEVDNIHNLKVSSSQALLTKDLDQAQAKMDSYTSYIDNGKAAKGKKDDVSKKEPGVLKNVDTIIMLSKNCGTKNFDTLDDALISLKSSYQSFGLDPNFGWFAIPSSNPDDAQALAKVGKLLSLDGEGFCKYVTDNKTDLDKLKKDFAKSVGIVREQIDVQISDFEKKGPRAQQILTAWKGRPVSEAQE